MLVNVDLIQSNLWAPASEALATCCPTEGSPDAPTLWNVYLACHPRVGKLVCLIQACCSWRDEQPQGVWLHGSACSFVCALVLAGQSRQRF